MVFKDMFAEFTVNLLFGFIIFGLVTFILLKIAGRINDPYRGMIRKLFLLSLFLMVLGWLISLFSGSNVSHILFNFGVLVAGCGVVIVLWEEFKKGYEEVLRGR
jgi:hypothetical protein